MRRLSDGSAMSEARRFKTLTLGRAVGGGVGGVAMPQATAQNQMIIADATPVWSLLAAPAAEYQILIAGADPYVPVWAALTVGAISDLDYATPALTLSTSNAEGSADMVIRSDATILVFDATVADIIQPDDAAAAGSASVAARRDHTHGIVCAAPASPSVSLAASTEGSGTSFARDDHAHQLDQAIAPTWAALHTFSQGTPANQHAVSYRLILLENDGSANLQIISETGAQDVSALVLSKAPATGDNKHWVVAHNDAGFSIGYRTSDGAFSASGATDRLAISTAGYFKLTVVDNVALAAEFEDAGGLEYLRIVSTDAQPIVMFNYAAADIDFQVKTVGQQNALFVQGSDGNTGLKTNGPATDFHVVGTTVANKHYAEYRTQILEDNNVVLQLIGQDATIAMAHVVFSSAPASGDNKHWIVSHLGPDASNRFSIGYKTSSADDFSPHDPTEYLTVSTAGAVHIRENSAAVRLTGTKEFGWIISGPIVETYGQIRIPWACTVTRVDANTVDGTSCTFHVEERDTLGSTGTNILSSAMVADANGESVTSSFNNSSLAEGNYLAIDVSAVSGAVSFVSIMVTVTLA